MGLITWAKKVIGMIFKRQAEEDFNVESVVSPEMESKIAECANIYRGTPYWVNADDNVKTINFAKAICSETARLATLAIGIQIDGSARAAWLQEQIDKIYFQIRHWVEYGMAYGTIILKPNGKGLDIFTPMDFIITDCDNEGIYGIVFKDSYSENDKYYTRFEYHRFVEVKDGENIYYPYYISNRAYVSRSAKSVGDPIVLNRTKWSDLLPETPPILKANNEKIDGPMFGILRTPQANNLDISSPLGLPIYAEAIEELKDLDVAYSRNVGEIFDSEKIILVDDRLMLKSGQNLKNSRISDIKLPHYAINVFGDGAENFYREIVPSLNTDTRITGINNLLSFVGFKCGYSNGYFVLDEKTGMVTATQVEADDRRTIQLIKDVRDKLESCLDGAIYALNVYADLYGLAPAGNYEITYDFGDITYNREEDRARWWQYVVQGKVPAWMYFRKFEGLSEEDAKAMVQEAQPKDGTRMFEEE
jgi:A118 family predicted phage portal protein|nr:MAG TPA: portal protein [Caudoviricetes sp.]